MYIAYIELSYIAPPEPEPEPEPEPGIEAQLSYLVNNGNYMIANNPYFITNIGLYNSSVDKVSIINAFIDGNGVQGSGTIYIENYIDSDGNVENGVFLIGQTCYEYTSESNLVDTNYSNIEEDNVVLNISYDEQVENWYTAIMKCNFTTDSNNNLYLTVTEAGRVEDWITDLNTGWNNRTDITIVTSSTGNGYGLFNVQVNIFNWVFYNWAHLKDAVNNYKNNEDYYGSMSNWNVTNMTSMYGIFQDYTFDGDENIQNWDLWKYTIIYRF